MFWLIWVIIVGLIAVDLGSRRTNGASWCKRLWLLREKGTKAVISMNFSCHRIASNRCIGKTRWGKNTQDRPPSAL